MVVSHLFISGSAYLLLPWFMWPYLSQLDPHQVHFNWCLGRTCALVECAFSHLNGRWHTLIACLKFTEDNIPWVIITALVHNICDAPGGAVSQGVSRGGMVGTGHLAVGVWQSQRGTRKNPHLTPRLGQPGP